MPISFLNYNNSKNIKDNNENELAALSHLFSSPKIRRVNIFHQHFDKNDALGFAIQKDRTKNYQIILRVLSYIKALRKEGCLNHPSNNAENYIELAKNQKQPKLVKLLEEFFESQRSNRDQALSFLKKFF